jgi:peroxiredoxin
MQKGYSKDSITVYVFLLDECRICQEMAPHLNEIYEISHQKGMGFAGVFPNYSSSQKGIEKFRKKYKIKFPLVTDHWKILSKKYNATILPEVIIINETTNQIEYQGAVNNLYYAPGKRRHKITGHYVKDAIFALSENKKPEIVKTDPIGCFINYTENPF